MSQQENPENFARIRRNLILFSTFVIFYSIGGIKIDEIDFIGNKADISNPSIIPIGIAIILIYFLLRYNAECRATGKIRSYEIERNQYKNGQEKLAATKIYAKNLGDNRTGFQTKKIGDYKYSVSQNNINSDIDIKKMDVMLLIAKTYLVKTIMSHGFFEYIFPYSLALSAILVLVTS